jgi:hypothetical protein
MLENIPVKAVMKAAQAERRMLEDDLANKRISADVDAHSILDFCSFLDAAARGERANFPSLPIEHCPFYRSVVERLVDAGELPFSVQEEVDHSFSKVLFQALTV